MCVCDVLYEFKFMYVSMAFVYVSVLRLNVMYVCYIRMYVMLCVCVWYVCVYVCMLSDACILCYV